ncbi:MAG: hypothetical protein JWR03_160 [Cohnella sp.]|nr:hypothetical protein [Cohnella sp.]
MGDFSPYNAANCISNPKLPVHSIASGTRSANLHLIRSNQAKLSWSGAKVHLNTAMLVGNPDLAVLECILAPER